MTTQTDNLSSSEAVEQHSALQAQFEAKLDSFAGETFPQVDITYVNRSTVLSNLLSDEEYSIRLKNREYLLKFKEPIYLHSLDIIFDGKAPDLLVNVKDNVRGGEVSCGSRTVREQTRRYKIGLITTEIKIQGKKKLLGLTNLSGLHLTGIHAKDFRQRIDWLQNNHVSAISLREKFEALNEKISNSIGILQAQEKQKETIQDEIEELVERKAEAENETSKAEKELAQVKTTQKKAVERNENLRADNQTLENSIAQQESQRSVLNDEISKKKQELAQLTADTNLFTEEIGTFNQQSNTQKRIYFVFSLLPVAVIAILGVHLYFQAASYHQEAISWAEALNLFVSRLPFLGAFGVGVWAMYNLARAFIQKVIDIDRQQLSFSKIAIIARETSASAAESLDLTPEEEYERRILLKMTLLKAHMREELGRQFDYQKIVEEQLRDVPLFSKILRKEKKSKDDSSEVADSKED